MDEHPPSPVHPGETLAALRASQERDVDREGIPMVLALVDVTTGHPVPVGQVPAEAGDLSDRLATAWTDLADGQRDGDLGAVQSILGAVAFADVNDGGRR